MARQAPIGHRIRGRRKDIGMTQNALAKAAGISASYLNLIEHNRRSIGGGLLMRIAEALEIHPHSLSGSEESRLLSDLAEVASDPVFRTTPVESREFPAMIAASPGMITAFLSLYRAYRSGLDDIDALSERLSHDPFLTEASHSILTRITSIRTVAEIFDDYDDLSRDQRARFNATLVRESQRLAESATEIFNFLERGEAGRPAASPAEEVDDLLYDNANHFPALEDHANKMRPVIDPDGGLYLTDLINYLEDTHNTRIERRPSEDFLTSGYQWDAKNNTLRISRALPITSARFQAARTICRLEAADPINEILDRAQIGSKAGRVRASEALISYTAAALLFPYDLFLDDARRMRHDIELLQQRYAARHCAAQAPRVFRSIWCAQISPGTFPNGSRHRACNCRVMAGRARAGWCTRPIPRPNASFRNLSACPMAVNFCLLRVPCGPGPGDMAFRARFIR